MLLRPLEALQQMPEITNIQDLRWFDGTWMSGAPRGESPALADAISTRRSLTLRRLCRWGPRCCRLSLLASVTARLRWFRLRGSAAVDYCDALHLEPSRHAMKSKREKWVKDESKVFNSINSRRKKSLTSERVRERERKEKDDPIFHFLKRITPKRLPIFEFLMRAIHLEDEQTLFHKKLKPFSTRRSIP